ncbi:MAG: DUF362 domain-containing protein [Eubacteriales bacterium]|nr:DUF362 domain-containing protein [Eubacteriales bacterium]
MPIVSVRHVAGYDDDALYQAICAHFEALEIEKELSPDTRVLLKPNILAGRAPDLAVTTHPAVLRALGRRLKELGVKRIVLADSPGGPYTSAGMRKAYATCGYTSLADLMELNEDVSSAARGAFNIIRPVLDADFIINCPKLKTHGLTVMTAGVKNMFGCIPGVQKTEQHFLKPTVETFSEMLVSLAETVTPALTVLDAVDCMEGNGPGGGKVRTLDYTLASRSVYALDEAAATLMALHPGMAPVIRRARHRGLCDPNTVTLVGDPLLPANPPFLLPDSILRKENLFTANGIFHRLFGRKRTYPHMIAEKCIGCGRCAESCPMHVIDITAGKAVISREGCISCFCCQEMCPAEAIDATGKKTKKSVG